jgi:hypothetical protein
MKTIHTLAPIAAPQAITPKTNTTNIVKTADSTMMIRIDSFIKDKFAAANGGDFAGIKDSASRAAHLGFRSSANVKYCEFLEAFQSSPVLSKHYTENYSQCMFLPWSAFHYILKALDLRVDLPEHYLGAVPDEQLPWMEIFELNSDDEIIYDDYYDLCPDISKELIDKIISHVLRDYTFHGFSDFGRNSLAMSEKGKALTALWKQAKESFFVVAPPDAFKSEIDWLERLKRATLDIRDIPRIPPNDPLVVRFVRGGVLVVAAWGDEAAYLNEAVKTLKL